MDTASFSSFIKTLIIIIAIWYFVKFAIRFFAPILITKVVKKAEENFQQKAQDFYTQNNNQSDGYSNRESQSRKFTNEIPKEKKKVGEYIDFEEIE